MWSCVLPNLYLSFYVHLNVLPNLERRLYVSLFVLQNFYVHLSVLSTLYVLFNVCWSGIPPHICTLLQNKITHNLGGASSKMCKNVIC